MTRQADFAAVHERFVVTGRHQNRLRQCHVMKPIGHLTVLSAESSWSTPVSAAMPLDGDGFDLQLERSGLLVAEQYANAIHLA